MKHKAYKLLSILLTLVMALGLLPGAFAAAPAEPAESNAGDVAINATNFPDAVFRSYVSETYDTDTNGYLSASEITAATTASLTGKGISDLKGVEYLTSLITLNCGGNYLTGIDVSQNTHLKTLNLNHNNLTTLNVSGHPDLKTLRIYGNPELTMVECQNCALTGLGTDDLPALTELYCSNNQLTSLDVSKNTALTELFCYNNQLTSLDVSENVALRWLLCDRNQLTSLDVSNNPGLVALRCDDNQLEGLYVSENTALEQLWATNNQLTSLELSRNTALENLHIGFNQLTSLDLSRNTALKLLTCGNNQLTSLDLRKNSELEELWCHANPLACLNISKTPKLQEAYRYGTVTTAGSDDTRYQYGEYDLVVDSELLLITDETDKGEYLLDLSEKPFMTQMTSEVNLLLQKTLRYAQDQESVIYLDDNSIDVNDDGIADFVIDQISGTRTQVYQKSPDTDLEGVFRLRFGDVDFVNMAIDDYGPVYSALAIKFTEVNMGEYVYDMSQGDAPYPWLEDDALYNSMDALTGMLHTVDPGFDLDEDGIWDFRVALEDGAYFMRPNPDSPITGDCSVPLTQETVEYLESRGMQYYSPITFRFPEKQPAGDLWVQGVPVTEENRNDILGDGKVRFEPEYRTLVLDDRPLTDGSWTAGDGWAVYAVGMDLTIRDTTGAVRLNAADASAALAKGICSDGSVSIEYDLCCENAVALVRANNIRVNGDCVECDLDAANSVYAGSFTRVREDGRIGASVISGQDITVCGDVHIETASGDCIQGGVQNDSDALGSVTVQGDLYLRASAGLGGDGWGVYSYGNITVEGNVDAECAAAVLEASFGDVRVDGDFRAVTGEGPQPVGNVGDEFRSAAGGSPDPEKYLFPFANGTPIIAIRGSVFLWGSVDVVTEACVGVFAGNELWPCGRYIDVEATEAAFLAGKMICGPASSVLDLPVGGSVRDCTINDHSFRTFTEADEVTVAPHVILHDSIYPLWVGGVQVGEWNQDDILDDGLASFDPKTNTLTLNETDLSGTYSWSETEWSITNNYSAVIYAGERLGNLTVNAPNGLSLSNVDRSAKGCGVYMAGGDLSFNGDLTAQLSDAAICTKDGSAVVSGSLSVSSTGQAMNIYGGLRLNGTLYAEAGSGTAVYVRNDFTAAGNVEIIAANGRGVYIGAGNLTALADFRCSAPYGVEIQNGGFRVDGSAVITAESAGIALLVFGKVTVGKGVWDVAGRSYAIAAAGDIELPAGSEITLPQGGRLGTARMGFAEGKFMRTMTVITEADGTTPANHAVIESVWENPFADVTEGKYYYKAVLWAYNHDPQVTGGTDTTHFGPNKNCTREQIVTFLWKAAGAPEPTSTTNPFTDVKPSKYYYKAVLWAVENNVTGGVSDTLFGVGRPCKREQAVTFLWKACGSPEPRTSESPFTDVQPGKYYFKPVLWAVENKITGGVTATLFGVGRTCTRAQIVTFLYKAFGPKD
ncbi:MAG: leucine-rich repeat domain-containing protein [Oscillospiraceae bacterium]|nr:leucine-rich repeat domain-containing protein [Oscillospiraceae bacterium]